MSPETGQLDAEALADLMAADPDGAMALLADAANATDARLRLLARNAAARIVIDLVVAGGAVSQRGKPRLRTRRLPDTGGDVDLEASLDALVQARASANPVPGDELRGHVWERPGVALCLLVDRSGSMGGARLATASVAAAAVTLRAPADFSVVAFADDAVVVKSQHAEVPLTVVVEHLLALRGHGTTDLALGLRAARLQLERSGAARRLVILLSDCRATAGADPLAEARLLGELAVVAPADDDADARGFAAALGARLAVVDGPSAIPAAFALLLER
ncbi:MAG: hypothetical protein NVS3B21_12370 [Acidimicrobiales bacterium]